MKRSNNIKKYISYMVFLCLFCSFLVSCSGESNNDFSPESGTPVLDDVPDFDYTDRVQLKVQIDGDGSIPPYRFDGLQPYFDQMGITMFPMVHFDELFKGNVSYEIEDNKVTITKNVLDVLTVVSVTADSNKLVRNGQEIEMNTTPVQKDGTIYIPLEYVGKALSYGVWWNDRLECVKFHQYTSVFVYVWNENEDSSLDGLRYSYIISGDYTTDMLEIKVNATSDYGQIRAVLKNLPSKAEVLTTRLYRVKGYAVPYEAFDKITDEIFDSGLKSSYRDFGLDEVPPVIKDLGDFTNEWFSEILFSMDEEAIYNSKNHVYRYFMIPSFWYSTVVRIEIADDGTGYILYKTSNESSEENTGGINISKMEELTKEETQGFLNLLNKEKYWNLPTEIDVLGLDGYEVVIEGIKDGKYHVVERWCPEKGDPVYSMEEYIKILIKEKFPE